MALNNIRLAFRSLMRRPGLSAMIVLMLALGIGATTALFTLFYQILIQPLPVTASHRLVNLSAPGPKNGSTSCGYAGDCDTVFSYPMFRDLEARQTGFTGIAAHDLFLANLVYRDRTLSGTALSVSGHYFSVLNLRPTIGRLIGPQDEEQIGEAAVVVLSHEYWKNSFGSDPRVINEKLTVNGQPLVIIGVAPAGFSSTTVGSRPEIFVPLTLTWRLQPTWTRTATDRRAYWLYVFGRLSPNTSIEQASASINSLYSSIIKDVEAPLNNATADARFLQKQIVLTPGYRGQSMMPENTEQPLSLLFGLTALILLIVCVNIANLLLVRGASRASEMAIRASVGASRRQFVFQLLTESTVLAIAGGTAGLLVAVTILDLVFGILPAMPLTKLVNQLSPPAVGFAAASSLVTVLLFGVSRVRYQSLQNRRARHRFVPQKPKGATGIDASDISAPPCIDQLVEVLRSLRNEALSAATNMSGELENKTYFEGMTQATHTIQNFAKKDAIARLDAITAAKATVQAWALEALTEEELHAGFEKLVQLLPPIRTVRYSRTAPNREFTAA